MADKPAVRRQVNAPILKLGKGKMVVMNEGTTVKADKKQVDLVFVFDTTGSMSDKIEALASTMKDLVRELSKLSLDWRVTVVPFGDLNVPGDTIVDNLAFVDTAEKAIDMLSNMPRFSGGNNYGESSGEAMLAAAKKPFRQKAVKVLVLITDEPACTPPNKLSMVHLSLDQLDAACFTVSPNYGYFKDWAHKHGGQWIEIGSSVDTSSILAMFKNLSQKIAKIADDVHRLGKGSVRAYLERGGE